jgi:hypothetical protein
LSNGKRKYQADWDMPRLHKAAPLHFLTLLLVAANHALIPIDMITAQREGQAKLSVTAAVSDWCCPAGTEVTGHSLRKPSFFRAFWSHRIPKNERSEWRNH